MQSMFINPWVFLSGPAALSKHIILGAGPIIQWVGHFCACDQPKFESVRNDPRVQSQE